MCVCVCVRERERERERERFVPDISPLTPKILVTTETHAKSELKIFIFKDTMDEETISF